MLSKSYAAMQQFQRQISEVRTFEEFKRLFQLSGIDLVLQVGSSTFWQLDWNPIKGTISGLLDLRIYPKIMMNQETYEARNPISLRLEDPAEITISRFQDRLMDSIKQSITSIGFQPS
jgi:hypothetical protein